MEYELKLKQIKEELINNKDKYFEIRECNSPHTNHKYIWVNETRINNLFSSSFGE